MDEEFWKWEGESSRWGYVTDEHRNAITLSARTIKEQSQFDNKKPEELESEFDHFYLNISYPSSPCKGCNIVGFDFVYKQLLEGIKLANHIILDIISKRKIDRSYKHFIPQFAELQCCNDGQNKHLRCLYILSVQQYTKFLLWYYLQVRIMLFCFTCKLG